MCIRVIVFKYVQLYILYIWLIIVYAYVYLHTNARNGCSVSCIHHVYKT